MRKHAERALEALLFTRCGTRAANAFLLIVFPLSWVARYWVARARDALR